MSMQVAMGVAGYCKEIAMAWYNYDQQLAIPIMFRFTWYTQGLQVCTQVCHRVQAAYDWKYVFKLLYIQEQGQKDQV